MKCPKCGNNISSEKKTCSLCGYSKEKDKELSLVYEDVDLDSENIINKHIYKKQIFSLVLSFISLILAIILVVVGKPIPLLLICFYVAIFVLTIVTSIVSIEKKHNILIILTMIFSSISFIITIYSIAMWMIEITE